MASSSLSSVSSSQWKYVVFLSFRGEDTRKTFMSHLYQSLKKRGIFTFQDDERLEYGDSIPDELLKAIEESQVAVVVLSKNYATSSWCLNELVKIMEGKDKNGQTVIPVFYDVDPSHVRNQTNSFAEAFAKHKLKYKGDKGMQKVRGWRNALTAAANLKGFDIRGGIEAENIQQITNHISKLRKSSYFLFASQNVGIDTQLEEVESLLKKEVDDVRIVGIWGMGGIGKTTIATTIFHKYNLSGQFEAACILDDVKENAKKNGLCFLQSILFSELLGEKDNCIKSKQVGKCMIRDRLCSMKVLIVLDDIDESVHLEYLGGDIRWFGNGSRVIVTTRNKDLIKINNYAIYEVKLLPDHEAGQLFYQYAFNQEVPRCFKNLSMEIVNHAKGLPLALKLWGSLLFAKKLSQWEIIVEKIKKNSSSEMVNMFKISYDGLEPEEQEIFLDIACFFRGDKRKKVMQILESCDFRAEYGLNVLIDKSLVFLTEYDTIEMHDLIQDMGRYIVKMQKHLGERSRLWNVEDFKHVMADNTGTMAVEAIWFTYFEQLSFTKEVMKNMKRLRILGICDGGEYDRITSFSSSDSNCHDGSIEYLPNNLHWFVWHKYPWKSLPENFKPQRLAHLDLRWSSLHHLWNEIEHLPSLRKLDLSHSKSLKKTPDFMGMPNLEYLDLEKCRSLEEVHNSLVYCGKLIRLNLYDCKRLKRFPSVNVESLGSLNLQLCSSLEKLPEMVGRMKSELEIHMANSGIRELPSSIYRPQTRLTELYLSGMKNLVALPSSISKLQLLVKLDVSGCSKLKSLPEEIGDLENLEELVASGTLISQPPSSIVRLNRLKFLSFAKLRNEGYFVFPNVNEGLHSLEILNLSYCSFKYRRLPGDIGCLSSLKELNLTGTNIEQLPRSIARLGALRSLKLSNCTRLTELPEFPEQLKRINADWSNDSICNSLFQNIFSMKHDISAPNSLTLRAITSVGKNIPSWFHHREKHIRIAVKLPKNWYVPGNFLGFAVCYSGKLIDTTFHLIPLHDDGMSSMTQKFSISNHSEYSPQHDIQFFLVPFAGLWRTSRAHGRGQNDYGHILLNVSGEIKKVGFRLSYKDDPYGSFCRIL